MAWFRRTKKPRDTELGQEVIATSTLDRSREYPATGLTPAKLASILRLADQGYIRLQQELFEDIEERYAHLFAVLQTRKLSVAGLPFEIVPGVEKDKRAEDAAKFAREAVGRIRNLRAGLVDLLDALGKGFSVVEPIWAYDAGKWWVERLEHRSQRKFTWDVQGRLRVLTDKAPVEGEEPPPDRLIVHEYRARSGARERTALLRVCLVPYLFATYGYKDWLTFLERFGHPYVVAKYEPGTPKDEKDILRAAAKRLASDSSLTCSKQAEIEIVNAIDKAATSDIYRDLIRDMDDLVSKAVLGQTQTTQIGPRSGSQASATVHDNVRQDIREGDALALGETLTDGLLRPLVQLNLGPDAPVPVWRFRAERERDLEAEARIAEILFTRVGLPVEKAFLYDRFAVPAPAEGAELLVVPPPAAPAFVGRLHPEDAIALAGRPPPEGKARR